VNISASYCVDIQAKGVDKAHGLRSVYTYMIEHGGGKSDNDCGGEDASIGRSAGEAVEEKMKHTIAFGDDLNDRGMLLQVGHGCIMQNANPKLKVEAEREELKHRLEVIGSNKEDSVCRTLRRVFDLPET